MTDFDEKMVCGMPRECCCGLCPCPGPEEDAEPGDCECQTCGLTKEQLAEREKRRSAKWAELDALIKNIKPISETLKRPLPAK